MAKTRKNARTPWTQALDKKLTELAEQNTATRSIAHSLDRSTDANYAHASGKSISPKPTNQSPYTRQKKG
jgi:putative aminopeptidase FrvX